MLLIFDIDGTLCLSSDIDNTCYVDACQNVLGAPAIDTDWANYPDATDPVIGRSLIEQHVPGAADDNELTRRKLTELQDAFLGGLRQRIGPAECQAVPGARELIHTIADGLDDEHPPIHAAIATGAWRASAELKLNTARIDPGPRIPLRTSSDADHRVDIIRAAWSAAETEARRLFDHTDVTYLGDGVWDAKAARELRVNFIGVGAEHGKADRLRRAGVEHVVHDLRGVLDRL